MAQAWWCAVVFIVIFFFVPESLADSTDKLDFENGFGDWTVENSSWQLTDLTTLKKNHSEVPDPPEGDSETFALPTNHSIGGLSIMHKDINIEADTELEVFFTCIVLGWKEDNSPMVRMKNPLLQVLYDEVLVFHLETAISQNSGHYVQGKWNQFRLFSSYKTNFTMRITVMGSHGDSPENLVAVDSIVIKMSKNSTVSEEEEPEIDEKDSDDHWDEIPNESVEEEEEMEHKNITTRPDYCDLLPERGVCHDSWPRYFYNRSSNACEQFTYGGCGGNENNFHVKVACEAICQGPEEVKEPESNVTTLAIDFENGFGGWDVKYWRLFHYESNVAKKLGIQPHNKSSKVGATPVYRMNTLLRPRLSHPLEIAQNGNLTVTFDLRLVGALNPTLHPFFEHLNPGFKLYIGDTLMFNFLLSGEIDNDWHEYTVHRESKSLMKDFLFDWHPLSSGSQHQLVRIEAWQGAGERGYIILDDFKLVQEAKPVTGVTTTPAPSEDQTSTDSTTSTKISKTTTTTRKLSFPCNLNKSKGPCRNNEDRFYYNYTSNTCKKFVYSGCKGNANNFRSLVECEARCIPDKTNVCMLHRDIGDCKLNIERFYYDKQKKKCVTFVYGGCGGNGNNFDTEANCEEQCIGQKESTAFPRTTKDCSLSIDRGSCNDQRLKVWGFSGNSHSCISFIFGGCGGNANRFYSEEECKKTCGHISTTTSSTSTTNKTTTSSPTTVTTTSKSTETTERNDVSTPGKRCSMPVSRGNCSNSVNRFYYKASTGECHSFVYSGCGGNLNNFYSMGECVRACHGHVPSDQSPESVRTRLDCLLPKKVGDCSGNYKRFYYDLKANECKNFTFTGCNGNNNRFKHLSKCESLCVLQALKEAKPAEAEGPSTAAMYAEVILGIILAALFIVAVILGIRYWRMKRVNNENYRIFSNEQARDSVGSSLGSASFEYDNPAYGHALQLEETREQNHESVT